MAVEFIPVFLAGIMAGGGNNPPWMVPAKATYLSVDLENAKRYFGLANLRKPTVFPPVTLRVHS